MASEGGTQGGVHEEVDQGVEQVETLGKSGDDGVRLGVREVLFVELVWDAVMKQVGNELGREQNDVAHG